MRLQLEQPAIEIPNALRALDDRAAAEENRCRLVQRDDGVQVVTVEGLLKRGVQRAGIGLTESFATTPGPSVSGLYFGHPHARYFSIGRLGRDQVADYAERKGVALAEAERWLRQNLAYEP